MGDRVERTERIDDRDDREHDRTGHDGHRSMLSFSPEERAEIVLTAEEAITPSDDR